MAWTDLKVKPSEVVGHAENLLTDRQTGNFDLGNVSPSREQVARSHLETALWEDGGLDQYIDDAGGPDALLDELEGNATLKPRLQSGVALAFLTKFAEDDAVLSGGRTAERQERFQSQLERWASSFGSIAAHELGYANTATSGSGGGFSQTMDRFSTKGP
jgi:hypothetical protein